MMGWSTLCGVKINNFKIVCWLYSRIGGVSTGYPRNFKNKNNNNGQFKKRNTCEFGHFVFQNPQRVHLRSVSVPPNILQNFVRGFYKYRSESFFRVIFV